MERAFHQHQKNEDEHLRCTREQLDLERQKFRALKNELAHFKVEKEREFIEFRATKEEEIKVLREKISLLEQTHQFEHNSAIDALKKKMEDEHHASIKSLKQEFEDER